MDAASSPILSRTACSIFNIVNLLPQIRYFLFLTSPKTDHPGQQAASWKRATHGQIRPANAVRSPIESVPAHPSGPAQDKVPIPLLRRSPQTLWYSFAAFLSHFLR